MRRRYQEGNVKKQRGVWIAQWWENGHRRSRALGSVWEMTKTEAKAKVAAIVAPFNLQERTASERCYFADFVEQVFLPFYRRKWKSSTASSTGERISFHVTSEFGKRAITSFSRDELQDFLDLKARKGLSYSVVSHLRWDLKQIFELAVSEGYLIRNPASMLFVPKEAPKGTKAGDESGRGEEDVLAVGAEGAADCEAGRSYWHASWRDLWLDLGSASD